jgi:small-conductance mechanosensitive channel
VEDVLNQFDRTHLLLAWQRAQDWVLGEVFVWASLVQLGVIVAGCALGWLLARLLRKPVEAGVARAARWEWNIGAVVRALASELLPILCLVVLLLARAGVDFAGQPTRLVTTAVSLLLAWIVIRLSASLIGNREVARGVAIIAWSLAALNIVGLLDPALAILDSVSFTLGERAISLLTVAKAFILLALLLWLAGLAGRFVAGRLARSATLTPSIRVLTEKTLRVLLLAAAFLITLNYVGVDLTAFAVFTGAIGVGLGFGLQKVVSNLISGFILLMDRSIKPGDVIEIEDTFGWVSKLSARYVTLSTRDGKEWLVPNEDLITQRVINWSYSNKLLRLPLKFGVSYHSDVRKAMELAIEAAKTVERVRQDPPPVCRLTGFGDSSVNFELRVWIIDPQAGVMNITSDIYLAMWDAFREHGIEIPFPQRDLHVQPGSEIAVSLRRENEGS